MLVKALESRQIQERFQREAGVEIPCIDSMSMRENLDSNETLKNQNNYGQRCHVFLDADFVPRTPQAHVNQLRNIVNICQNICIENDTGKVPNIWNPWSINCDLSVKTQESFQEPYVFPPVNTVATDKSTVILCRAIYGTLDNEDAPVNVIIYENDHIVKSFFRNRPNGFGYCDHAIRELGFPPCANTPAKTITSSLIKLNRSIENVQEEDDNDLAHKSIAEKFLDNMTTLFTTATFSGEHHELLGQLFTKASENLNIVHIRDKWDVFVAAYKAISRHTTNESIASTITPSTFDGHEGFVQNTTTTQYATVFQKT
ncbi:hypothetical protein IV203_037848 [Nitzschia inconspicua]|uniref:Uncharacterized protein n=1 Tax=Nitzschia inconspicua TaxID=303405 RepID=A0A9K3PYY7_9STRA|nr:hypothetical protein IV203_037848 [Nitzschia inconspicua]